MDAYMLTIVFVVFGQILCNTGCHKMCFILCSVSTCHLSRLDWSFYLSVTGIGSFLNRTLNRGAILLWSLFFAILCSDSIVIHSVNQRLLRNPPGNDSCDLLRERLPKAFTRANNFADCPMASQWQNLYRSMENLHSQPVQVTSGTGL